MGFALNMLNEKKVLDFFMFSYDSKNCMFPWNPVTKEEFKRHRRKLGWTQKELAQKLQIDKITISRYERGVQPIPYAVALAVMYLVSEVSKMSQGS